MMTSAARPPTLPGAASPPTAPASPPTVPDAVLLASSPTASAPVPIHVADPVPARSGSAPAVPTTAPRPVTPAAAAITANTTAATLPLPNSLPRSVSAPSPHKKSHRAAVRQWLRTRWPFWRSFYDIQLTLGAFAFIVICTYITCLANSTVDRTNPNNLLPIDQRRPLDDPAKHATFKLYRETGLPRNLSDTLVQLAAAMIILRGVTYGRYGCTVLRRAFYVGGIIYLLRAPTVLMTVLPNPLLDCVSHPNPNLFVDALLLLVQARYSCGDVFFSGHSIFFVLAARIWITYCDWRPVQILALIFGCLALFSLVFTSYHYSIDVWIAALIITTVYTLWHWTVKYKVGRDRWWGRLVRALDGQEELDRRETMAAAATAHSTTASSPESTSRSAAAAAVADASEADPETVVVVVPAAHAMNETGSGGRSGTPAATKMVQIPVAASGSPFTARSQQGAGGSSSAVVSGGPRATSPVRHRAMSPSSSNDEKRGGGYNGSMHDLHGGA
ncbi:hypothetical protein, variant [Allomyces macrogynus ATCC 38327]|uniref:Sphingomyelin synthase-like domain-containing protein n=1 Tax=Allomyces macrogynus (strain ATCC 38327) TaxID=578462 RepID=A0A0L0SK08_ALLM3|nr:hypothetical protein, variant [Allomyces macrogynus ATCC 38327]|eukprot:KNE62816.1 hypothetical protein, variant [Allomyces macrogynus ATCC 38327]